MQNAEYPSRIGVIAKASPVILGYARVSTRDQSVALQVDAPRAAGCAKVVTEVGTGKTSTLERIRESLEQEKEILVSQSSALNKLSENTARPEATDGGHAQWEKPSIHRSSRASQARNDLVHPSMEQIGGRVTLFEFDTLGLFSRNVGSFSLNVSPRGRIFSANLVPERLM